MLFSFASDSPPAYHLLLTYLCSVTRTHGKNETGHVAEMRLMVEATRGGSQSQYDKPCELAHVNTRVTRTEGDSCVSDARRHAAVDRLPPLLCLVMMTRGVVGLKCDWALVLRPCCSCVRAYARANSVLLSCSKAARTKAEFIPQLCGNLVHFFTHSRVQTH